MPKVPKAVSKKIPSKKLFPVVGVGASAGGLEAFKKLVGAIPANSGMAYILVQHLHPEHSSTLPEILQRETSIPVQEVSDNVKVKPDNIYVIPSNSMLVANDGVLQLSPRPAGKKNNLIDIFFSSLAEVHQNQAIGIVLSGTGMDGTIGLKKIKDHGGVTFAQDPASAAYEDMPQSAVEAEVADFIMLPEEMPHRLMEIIRTLENFDEDDKPGNGEKSEEESYRNVLSLVRLKFGADFNFYKQTTIRRRILRRLAMLKVEKIADYLRRLQDSREEQETLFRDLLIPVTSFFRDAKTFKNICESVFPELLKDIPITIGTHVNPLRIWVAGCSTGEEAYSLGICLYEFLSDKASNIKVQIFATDISKYSIAKARAGVYSTRQLEGISDARLQQFFSKADGSYQIKKIIRDMCVFATHNFLKDPPFARMDFISCRNVLIYMEPILQKKAFAIFHYALNEKGFLLLGKSESAGSSGLFRQADKKDKVFTKKLSSGKFINVNSFSREEKLKDTDYAFRGNERNKDDFQKNADDILLAKYTPPGVIVNEQFDILQFRGSTGPYLEPSPGKASLNVLKMARYGLAFELRNGLHKAKAARKAFTKEGIPADDGKKVVSIEVIPLLNTIDLHFLILFRDHEVPVGKAKPGDKENRQYKSIAAAKDARVLQLEKDLLQARENMRSITEDQEAANEELQSANEELLSGSEELQSLNEELETSKEELQSTNEELITVNQELFDRNEQYNRSRLYAEAIVTAAHEPLLVLNHNFTVKSANKAFFNIFALTEKETLGKVLFTLQNDGWNIFGLRDQLLRIQSKTEAWLEWETTYNFPGMGERTIVFNAQPIPEEDEKHLILLALDDITEKKKAGQLQDLENLKLILDSVNQITFSTSAAGEFTYFNNYFLDYAGISLRQALEEGWLPFVKPQQQEEATKAWEHSISTLNNLNIELELKRKSDGMYRWHICRALAIVNEAGQVASWVGTATDIQEQKIKEKEKDDFVSIASHELKTPLTSAKAFVQLLEHGLKRKNDDDLIFAEKASASIDRINELVAELLDVSKIQHGKFGLKVTSFDFNKMLIDVIESVQMITPSHKIMLENSVHQKVSGDHDRLGQVVNNLLNNAVKYSPKSDEILVRSSMQSGEIKVSVNDNGIGISKKNLNKVFDRYYREEGRAMQFQGLGISLSISKEIIQRHNGKIWAESEPGKGSTFYFTLSAGT
ncbi:MAG: chemotaxis protein CheB [Ginsengibacter sp.]